MRCFFSPIYTLSLPDGHPFPVHKYDDIASAIIGEKLVLPEDLVDPGLVSRDDILRVHGAEYLGRLECGRLSREELRRIGFPWSQQLVDRTKAAVAGTIAAAKAALSDGIAFNLAGGMHHAFPNHGEGYCLLNDVAIAVKNLLSANPSLRVMVIDLDAHQGNGTHYVLGGCPQVYTYSTHVRDNYPSSKYPGTQDIEFDRYVDGSSYLSKLMETLEPSVRLFSPDLALFIAGVDPHKDDRFGQMSLTEKDLFRRDKWTIDLLRSQTVPIACVLGGGYNKDRKMTSHLHRQTVAVAVESSRTWRV